jgi:hypothetical protein
MAEIDDIAIAPWEDEPAKLSDEKEAKAYRVTHTDGSVTMRDERPEKPDGIASLSVRNDADYGRRVELRDGRRRLYWYRLWWHPDKSHWLVVSPELEAFQKLNARCASLADDLCVDENARIAAHIDRTAIEHELLRDRSSSARSERARLRASCRQAAGSDEKGALLARFHELTVDIGFAKTPRAKVEIARARRDVLRQLVVASR